MVSDLILYHSTAVTPEFLGWWVPNINIVDTV